MKRARFAPLAALLATALVSVASPDRATTQENADVKKSGNHANSLRTGREAIEAVLAEPVHFAFEEAPLQDVINQIKSKHKIEIQLDSKVLSDAGIDPATLPITFKVDGISLHSALSLILRQGLTHLIKNEVVFVTTRDQADTELETRVYGVLDLVAGNAGEGFKFDPLIHLITGTIATQTWSELGGPGEIDGFQDNLTVSQTSQVQEQIAGLLSALRAVRKQQQAGPSEKSVVIGAGKTLTPKLEKLLALKTNLKYDETPLSEVLADINDRTGIRFYVDSKVLSDAGIDPATLPITIDLQNVSARAAIDQLLSPIGLTWYYADETPIITLKDEADTELMTVVYPVADLVGPYSQTEAEKQFGLAIAGGKSLINLITGTISTATWDDLGGPGMLDCFGVEFPALVVSQTREVQEQIETLLADLRNARRSQQNSLAKLAAEPPKPEPMVLRYYLLRPDTSGAHSIPPKELAQVVKNLTDAKNWDEKDAYIQGVTGRLIVRQKASIHRAIKKLLEELDALQPTGGFMGGGNGTMSGQSGGGSF